MKTAPTPPVWLDSPRWPASNHHILGIHAPLVQPAIDDRIAVGQPPGILQGSRTCTAAYRSVLQLHTVSLVPSNFGRRARAVCDWIDMLPFFTAGHRVAVNDHSSLPLESYSTTLFRSMCPDHKGALRREPRVAELAMCAAAGILGL